MTITRASVLYRYGLPDASTFEMAAQQDAQQTRRAKVKHDGVTVNMSLGHLASLAHEIHPVDPGLAKQIRAVLKNAGF